MTQPLHVKYRPSTLEQVVGQDHIIGGLTSQLNDKAQVFLFEGPSGTGKTTLARICASMLDCEVIEVDAASNTGVDDMREVASKGNFVSLDGKGKFFIIDECHRLSRQAVESLLKTIEEPPTNVYWAFCTTEPTKILKTMRTRCVTHTLNSVPWRRLMGMLADVAKAEGIEVIEDIIDVCAETADGSPRQALVNLTSVMHTKTADEARTALSRTSSAKEAYDLAKMLIDQSFRFGAAMEVLKEIKDTPAESIRQVVRAYATTVVLNSPENNWARGVLMAFEAVAVEQNQISDIVCRVITLDKWRRPSGKSD